MRNDRPGYQSRPRSDGTLAHYWNPKRAVKGAPDHLKTVRLLDGLTDDEIKERCQQLTDRLRKDLDGYKVSPRYDGTISGLIDQYMWDKTSSIHSVKYSTRRDDYEPSLIILKNNVGKRRIDALKASDFKRWYSEWRKRGHRRAWGAVKMLRGILSYGAGERLHGCVEARATLSALRFEPPSSRKVAMTFQQCSAIVESAIESGDYSIAFVQALQFETALRRIDIIGEWVPNPPHGNRWTGLSAGQISKDLILTLTTSKTDHEVKRDLKDMPLVMRALEYYELPKIGPIVLNENTGQPYLPRVYRRHFNAVRESAGVPNNVWSMDSRAGAVTETAEADSLEAARQLATHANIEMTQKYDRGDGLERNRKVSLARAKLRE